MIITEEMIKNSLVSKGDISKVVKVINKAKEGADITVAFLGGSITQGCNATAHEDCYAYRTYLWFKNTFENINVNYINAGVGATGSVIGVHRVERQVLSQNPDIIFIDFAVNDKDDIYHKVAYESLIRRILLKDNSPAIIEIFMSTETGDNVQEQQVEIGRKYNIPMVSFRDSVKLEIENGRLEWKDVATDEVHPNDYGHFIIEQLLTSFFSKIFNEDDCKNSNNTSLGEPLFGDKYINGEIFNSCNTRVDYCKGFNIDKDGFQVFNNGWKFDSRENKEANLKVEIMGKNIFLLYKKTISNLNSDIEIKFNNSEIKVINNYFENGWGDYAQIELLVEKDIVDKNTIEISIKKSDKDAEVCILGFLVS